MQTVERLVHEGLPLTEALAHRFHKKLGGVIAVDELLSIARPVLFECARTHDPSRAPFFPFLTTKVKWALIDEARRIRGRTKLARRAAAIAAMERLEQHDIKDAQENLDTQLRSEEEYQSDVRGFLAQRAAAMVAGMTGVQTGSDDAHTPESGLAYEQLRHDLLGAVERLDERQRELVRRHYFEGERFDTIAADLGISKSWASRIHAQAMESLAAELRDRHT